MLFETTVILLAIVFVGLLQKANKKTLLRFGLAFCGILLFEYFTQSLWVNEGLEPWAYLYLDISWILTIGWSTIVVVSMAIIENYGKKLSKTKQMLSIIGLITVIGIIAEWVVVNLGIREYALRVQTMLAESPKILGNIPLREIIYIPAFMFLVVFFIKYWESSKILNKRNLE